MSNRLNHIQNWAELARQAEWSVAKLAKLCKVSRETLRGHFLHQFGKSPAAWLAEERQKVAIALLWDGSSFKEIATSIAYKQQTNFTRQFKKHWGMSPMQMKRSG